MNQSSQEILSPAIEAISVESGSSHSLVSDIAMLTKVRLTMLVLITTFVGFCMASGDRLNWILLFHTLFGTALVAGGASVLNQLIEIKVDLLMERTKDRPLPAGRMRPVAAFRIGIGMAAAGMFYLALAVNLFAASLAALTLVTYLFLYTPLKRRTCFCITVGAVSGAIPPVIGWVAARPSLDIGAWILFGVLFLWQMPHFMAIAWMYRDEYARAGFVMLPRNDVRGFRTSLVSLLYASALTAVTLLPAMLKMTGMVYFFGAVLFNVLMLFCAVQFFLHRERSYARRLFFASILYLPILLGLLVFTKL
jgi:protoheme IX farnesyltransferase